MQFPHIARGAVKQRLPTNGGTQEVKYIPEGDLYRLIIRSKLPAAEKFERWVFDEVLPELKRSGSYGNNVNLEDVISKTATAVVSEVMKQLIPVLSPDNLKENLNVNNSRRRGPVGIIGKLDSALKKEVEEMIMSDRFCYLNVVNYLNGLGIEISIGSVWRYAQRMKEFAV